MKNLTSNFHEDSLKERYCLIEIFNIFKEKGKKFEWLLYMTDLYGSSNFDAAFIRYSENTIKVYYIEIKIRNKHYKDMILEEGKAGYLIGKSFKEFDKPLYINCTPNGTYSWELDKMKRDNKLILKDGWFPKTSAIYTGNITKKCFYLKISDATNLQYIFDEKKFYKNYQENVDRIIKENNKCQMFKKILNIQ